MDAQTGTSHNGTSPTNFTGPVRAGVIGTGSGDVNVAGDATGQVNNYSASPASPVSPASPTSPTSPARTRPDPTVAGSRQANIGIISVLPQEMRAVVHLLKSYPAYGKLTLDSGCDVHLAALPPAGGTSPQVIALRSLQTGTHSAMVAYRELRDRFDPAIVVLVGIAGGVGPAVRIGDVVVSDLVISYDHRREAEDGTHHRTFTQTVSSWIGHRLNGFFDELDAVEDPVTGEAVRIHRGPIGSGNAVITNAGAGIRGHLSGVNEKVLAVETEAAGLAQAFHEEFDRSRLAGGWLTVRGISDLADGDRTYDHYDLASRHAALVTGALLPYLVVR